jgi:hypothetical protein
MSAHPADNKVAAHKAPMAIVLCSRVFMMSSFYGKADRDGRRCPVMASRIPSRQAQGTRIALLSYLPQSAASKGVDMAQYSPKASRKVEKVMHEFKEGTLKSGSNGKTVKSRKQAVAIGLSEARHEGDKVPPASSHARKGGGKSHAAHR